MIKLSCIIDEISVIQFFQLCLLLAVVSFIGGCASKIGCVKGNCVDGEGTYIFPSGNIYTGEFKNGKYNGHGTYTFSDGKKYIGELRENKFNGSGTYYFPDGRKYSGLFRNNMFNGIGTLIFPGGKKYVGFWKDNKLNLKGNYTAIEQEKKHKKEWETGALKQLEDRQYETSRERSAKENEAVKKYETNLSTRQLDQLVRTIPAKRVSDNLRIYQELLRREPDNPKYRKKVEFYKTKVDRH